MIPLSWSKQPSEKRSLAIDASRALITGDTIASYEVKIFDEAGTDCSLAMIAGSSNTSAIIYVWVQAGTSGLDYFLRVKITTTLGEIIEDDLNVIVWQQGK